VEQPALCDFLTSLEATHVFTFFTWLGIFSQFSVTRMEKKFLLTSSLAAFGLTFNGSSVLLVALPA
jgi:hypothetical protein